MCINKIINYFQRYFRRTKIIAVHEYDLQQLLISINVYDDLIAGNFYCRCCNNQINMENLWGIIKLKDCYDFICDNPTCISQESIEIK